LGQDVVCVSQVSFSIDSSTAAGNALSGGITADPVEIEQGEETDFSYQVTNTGNVDISELNLEILLVRDEDGTVTRTLPAGSGTILNRGESFRNNQVFNTSGMEPGKYLVILRGGETGSELETVDGANLIIEAFTGTPPVAEAGGPYAGECGVEILFNGGESHDLDGEIRLYEWDFNTDGIYEARNPDPEVYHAWNDAFSGVVTLRVTDDDGLSSTDTAEVKIECVIEICGDLDHDGDVDGDDRNILRGAFRTTADDAGFIEEADYDEDGDIDYSDYQLWYACYNEFIE
jgi:hypothetical protein